MSWGVEDKYRRLTAVEVSKQTMTARPCGTVQPFTWRRWKAIDSCICGCGTKGFQGPEMVQIMGEKNPYMRVGRNDPRFQKSEGK